jgi:Protein of unknown function (DUF1553)/Protein of unknown function (DUF1549)/Planctomycete cytochrome C
MRIPWRIGLCILGLVGLLAPVSSEEKPATGEVRYNRDIRPILSNRCFKCHGPDLKKAGLDLQTRDSATRELKSGMKAIVPGNAAASHIIERVLSIDDKQRMPPKGKGEPLSPQQVAMLKAWIDQGAKWEEHWAYVKPQRPPLPAVKNQAWPRNGIDYFVLARLEADGLGPSPEADRATLVRRVSLDLTGLAPTIAELDAALGDNSPNWYEKVVDRLLASPHYGERQAHPWLDMARYADTNGYENDARRTIWPYRDWVINAFNRDLPFDQFTIEQIAGDLLPNATQEQKVATGFHRNTMVNTEGGTDDEEFRVAAVVDRVNTTMAVWMGTTINCCQCHNHKFDPFSQKEFYQLYGFFNNTEDRGRSTAPEMSLPTPAEVAQMDRLNAEIAKLRLTLDTTTPELAAAHEKWEKAVGQKAVWLPLEATSMKSAGGATLTKQKDGSILAGGTNPATDTYTLVAQTDLKGITAFRLEALPDKSLPKQGPGRAGNFVLSELKVTAAGQPIALQNADADFAQNGWPVAAAIDGDPKTGWAVDPQYGKAHTAVFETKQDVGGDGGSTLTFVLEQNYGGQHTLGRFRISATTSPRPVRLGGLPDNIAKLMAVPADKRTQQQKDEVAKYHRSIAPELKASRDMLAALQKELAAIKPPSTLVLKELPQVRETFIHIRGNHTSRGDTVTPGVPAKLHPLKAQGPKLSRLDLAKWLVDPDNPMVGRVTMNRVWAEYFGRGLVETSEDFGIQGELPTHPELLNWLACEFPASGGPASGGHPSAGAAWSMKKMHKLIVMSATYRQSAKVTKELYQRDQFNRLFARGPRFRMDAEMVRDNALAISGLLNRKIGGPSVFPYQPGGVWANPYSGDKWETSTNGEQYRRGLYTFWRRTAPYAAFMAFDAPSREVCTERRPRTNTPLQALATLNDKAFVDPAAALARRMMGEPPQGEPRGVSPRLTAEQRATLGFRLCTARPPTKTELTLLLSLYQESLEKYRKDPSAAKTLATAGIGPPPSNLDIVELAAWTVVANVLLNLDETLTKG